MLQMNMLPYPPIHGDCDDFTNAVYPNLEEICDGIDNDCNGFIDDDDGSTVYEGHVRNKRDN